jgi:Zn-dependent peptidase ImmA (M78 family)
MPTRPLTQPEALHIAELQAVRLLALGEVDEPPVPEGLISELPRVKVERLSPLPMSGYTTWSNGRWLIVLNRIEPYTRQRFSLFHETKHMLDHPFVSDAYGKVQGQSPQEWAERVCDHFAACLLMPKPWVKRIYCNEGVQQVPELARRFGVSQAAMRLRLLNLGLIEPTPRHYWRAGTLLVPGMVVAA